MDENEFMKAIQEKLNKMTEYDKKTVEANLKNRNEIIFIKFLQSQKNLAPQTEKKSQRRKSQR